ncbi:pentapeptide repeat-containing protein [Clostridium sp.]|uniref:pentapeptide repeat-containing protein n=1 Tax=Clostridium sp. TaxID=1506 RepID=UPI002637E465|nr:pentapeptide repeat-containing protein [Clostridium sp.]
MEEIISKYLYKVEECKEKMQKDIFINKDILCNQIVQAFDIFLEKVIKEQNLGNKKKIQAINISLLKVGFKTKGINCIIEAFDDRWLFDNCPIVYSFKLDNIFDEFYTLEDSLKNDTKKYFKYNFSDDIEEIILSQLELSTYYVIELVRYSINDIVRNSKFDEISKENNFYIVAGEYRDKGLIIYSENNTYEDLNSSIIHMDKMKTLRSRYFKRLRFKNKKYLYHDFIGSNFDESMFGNVELKRCALSQVSFKNCIMKNINLEGSILHDSFFDGSSFENVNFNKVYSTNSYDGSKSILTGCIGMQFKNAQIKDSTFRNSIINGSNFNYASLENIDFSECELKESDFRNSILINVNFTGADLKDTYFTKEQLSNLDLSKEQLNSIRLG